MKKHSMLIVVLLFAAVALGAQEKQFSLSPAPRFWGASILARYSLAPPTVGDVETAIIGGLSGAYETVGYYRNPDGSLFEGGDGGFTAEQSNYNRFDLYWQAGVQQGILPRYDTADDLAVAFFYYRGRYDLPFDDGSLYFSSGLPETNGGLLGSVHAGLAYSDVNEEKASATKQGSRAELVLQWGPSFLHNAVLGSANFTRFTLSTRTYWTLFRRINKNALNLFSLYSASFAAVDWATGPDVPMAVRSTIGTRSERPGTGGSVRGYEFGRFDATFKVIANTELRANLPAFTIPAMNIFGETTIGPFMLVPGILVYYDAALYRDADSVSPVGGEESGQVMSTGAGFYVNAWDIAEIILYTNYLIGPPAVDGSQWVPLTVGFGFHF